jgi:hypothetical protein
LIGSLLGGLFAIAAGALIFLKGKQEARLTREMAAKEIQFHNDNERTKSDQLLKTAVGILQNLQDDLEVCKDSLLIVSSSINESRIPSFPKLVKSATSLDMIAPMIFERNIDLEKKKKIAEIIDRKFGFDDDFASTSEKWKILVSRRDPAIRDLFPDVSDPNGAVDPLIVSIDAITSCIEEFAEMCESDWRGSK